MKPRRMSANRSFIEVNLKSSKNINIESTIFKVNANNGLSTEKLEHNMNLRHARLIRKHPKSKLRIIHKHFLAKEVIYMRFPICRTKTGWSCCCKSSRKSDFSPYGVGMVLYFQLLKHLTIVFLMMAVMSIPAYIFFFSGNQTDPANYGSVKYILAAFSLGNIG